MMGMEVGEERTVTVTLPQSWEPEQLRGVQADCSVKVKEIFEWQLPEVCHQCLFLEMQPTATHAVCYLLLQLQTLCAPRHSKSTATS